MQARGAWSARQSEDARAGLILSRQRYLEQKCVLQEAEALVLEVISVLGGGDEHPSDKTIGLYKGQDTSVYKSLHQHLAVTQAMQRLRLPAQNGNLSNSGAADVVPERDGSCHHLMGVTAEVLKQQHLQSKKAAQKAHRPILPDLEARLTLQAQTLVANITGGAPGSDGHAHVLQLVQEKVAAVEAEEQEVLQWLQQCNQEAQSYLHVLAQVQQLLGEVLEDCLLNKQHAADKVHCERLITHVRVLFGKLKVVEAKLEEMTYTKDTLPALQSIGHLLDDKEVELQHALDQVSAQLLAYEQCGEEFSNIVWEYGKVKEEMRKVDHAVQKFAELQQELEHGSC